MTGRLDPCWRKARIAARLLLKKEGSRWNARDLRHAAALADDPAVTNRLIQQALNSFRTRARKNGT